MPKAQKIDVLYGSVEVEVQVPANYDEADAAIGETGGALKGFISDCSARNFLPRLYKGVAAVLEAEGEAKPETHSHLKAIKTGSKNTKKVVDGKETTVSTDTYETDIVHIGRVYEKGDDEIKSRIAQLLMSTANSIPFYSARDGTGSGAIAEKFTEAANKVFAAGPEKVGEVVSKVEELLVTKAYKITRDAEGAPTIEGLARGLYMLEKKMVEDAKRAAAASTAGLLE